MPLTLRKGKSYRNWFSPVGQKLLALGGVAPGMRVSRQGKGQEPGRRGFRGSRGSRTCGTGHDGCPRRTTAAGRTLRRNEAGVSHANTSIAHHPTFSNASPGRTWHPQTQPGPLSPPRHRSPPQNHTSSPSRNVSAPRRQDGQMEQEDSPRMYQVMKKSMGSNREKRARFSCGAQPRAPAAPPARPGWGSQGPPAPAAARRPRESRTGAGLRL